MEKSKIITTLEELFPNIELVIPTHLINDDKDCVPEYRIGWYEFLKKLESVGLSVDYRK